MHVRIVPEFAFLLLGLVLCACTSKAPGSPGQGGSPPSPGGATPAGAGGPGGSNQGGSTSGSGGTNPTTTAGSGGGGGSQAGASGSGGSSGPARRTLSPSEFVFTRLLRQGTAEVSHIHTYNLETGVEGLVTTLDNDKPGSVATVTDIAVSPDRSQLVFSSGGFRPDPVQVTGTLRIDALWKTDLEGKEFRRLTPEYNPDYNQGAPCGSSTPNTLPCIDGEVCRLARCVREDLRVRQANIVWTSTGQIFHQSFQSWWLGGKQPFQVGYLISVTPDGRHESHDMPGRCKSVHPAAVAPSTQQLLIFRWNCGDGVPNGLASLSLEPLQERQVLIRESPELNMLVSRGGFSPDEKTFYFTARGAGKSVGLRGRTGLYRLTVEGAQVQRLFESTVDNEELVDLTVLPNGVILVEVETDANNTWTSRLARFQTTSNTLEYLPIQGNVGEPR